MEQVDELTNLLSKYNPSMTASSHSQSAVPVKKSSTVKAKKSYADVVEGDIIILNRNPEMFLKQLRKPDDDVTKKLLLQNQSKIQIDDYSGIFENTFKLKLLVAYLQNNPAHFMTLLRSNSLTSKQLITLSNVINNTDLIEQGQAQIAAAAATPEGFWDGAGAEADRVYDPIYQEALSMLESKIQKSQSQSQGSSVAADQYTSYLSQLESPNKQDNECRHVMHAIQQLNNNVSDVRIRSDMLDKLLAQQSGVLGFIISKQNGRCIGAIDNNGKIKHCAHQDAQSPYDIIVNKQAYSLNIYNILQQHNLHGSSINQILKQSKQLGMQVLGQCVNVYGKTVGLIVRQNNCNHYIPTQPADPVPNVLILAILVPNKRDGQGTDLEAKNNAQVKEVRLESTLPMAQEVGYGALLSQEELEEEHVTTVGRLDNLYGKSDHITSKGGFN